MKKWFYRCTAVHFILTSITGVILYFRPGGERPGAYSTEVKEWMVMIHNGEWISYLLLDNPFVSGIVFGVLLAFALIKFSLLALGKKPSRPSRPPVEIPTPPVTSHVRAG